MTPSVVYRLFADLAVRRLPLMHDLLVRKNSQAYIPERMDWINRHASEILVAVITALLVKGLDYFFAKRSKVVFFYTNGASFNLPPVGNAPGTTASTITLALWNTGRAVAEDIRIVHAYWPAHYQVWPPMSVSVNPLPSGHHELVLPRVLAKQIVYVSYLDAVPLSPAMIVQLNASDHQIQAMPFQFTRVFPPWVNGILFVLLVLGIWMAVRYAYFWGVALVRFLASLGSP